MATNNNKGLNKIEKSMIDPDFVGEVDQLNQQLADTANDLTQRMINVRQPPYNAKGDGLTDDTAAIQAALNTKKLVYLPQGTYLYSNLVIPLGTAGICGQEMATNVTRLKHIPGDGSIQWNGSGRVQNASFKNLYIEGSGHTDETYGFDISGFSYCHFENIYIRLFKLDGLYGDGAITPVNKQLSNNTFAHCRFNNNSRDGLRLESSDLKNNENSANSFLSCEFGQNGGYGVREVAGESNYYLGCTSQGNEVDVYLNGRSSVFHGYTEGKKKSCRFGSKSKRCEIKVRSAYPIWNTFIDDGQQNHASIYGEYKIEKNLFHDPYFLTATSLLPPNLSRNGIPAISYSGDAASLYGHHMKVIVDKDFQGLIFKFKEPPEYLAGKWVTLIAEIDTSGVVDDMETRIYTRTDGNGNAVTGQLVQDKFPITEAGKFTTLFYDVKFSDDIGLSKDIIWYLAYSGITQHNTIKIRSIHIVEGQTRQIGQYSGIIDKTIAITQAELGNANNAINTTRKYSGKVLYDSTAGKMRFAIGSSPTSAWRNFDGSGDITPS